MDDYEGEGLFEDEEPNENEGFELMSGGKERIIYLVDCHPHMFLPTKDDEEDTKTFFDAAMEAIASDLKNRIISQASDETGLCFFNTREKKNVHGWEGIYVFQECDVPSAQRIEEVSKIGKEFEAQIGARKQAQAATINPVYHALFTAQSMMQSASKLGVKRVLLFTNNDDPLAEVSSAEQRSMRNQTIAKARDMVDSNMSIELLPMSRPGEEFDIRLLYKDVMSEGEEDDPTTFLVNAKAKFDDMLVNMRKKMLKKRVQRKMSLTIAPGVEIGINLYALVRTTKPSRAGTLDSRSQQPLKVETKYICGDTGGELARTELKKYYPYGGEKVVFKAEELQEVRELREPGLQLLGFKSLSCLKPYHNLNPPGFLYPSDEKVTGSIKAFIALHTAMVKFQKFAVCCYMASIRSNVKLVALVAQEQVLDDFGVQLMPSGFQLIPLPFAQDIRDPVKHHVSEEGPAPRATQEQIDRAAELLKKIDLGKSFDVTDIPNPALQKHYASLQALALDEDTIPEIEDCTLPDDAGMSKPHVSKAVDAFKESIYGANWEEAEAEVATAAHKPSEAAKKRKAAADLASTQQAQFDWKNLAQKGELNTLKNDELKSYCRANGLQVGGSKMALIQRILDHLNL